MAGWEIQHGFFKNLSLCKPLDPVTGTIHLPDIECNFCSNSAANATVSIQNKNGKSRHLLLTTIKINRSD